MALKRTRFALLWPKEKARIKKRTCSSVSPESLGKKSVSPVKYQSSASSEFIYLIFPLPQLNTVRSTVYIYIQPAVYRDLCIGMLIPTLALEKEENRVAVICS